MDPVGTVALVGALLYYLDKQTFILFIPQIICLTFMS